MDTQKGSQKENDKKAETSSHHPILDSQGSGDSPGHNKEEEGKQCFWQKWNTIEKFTFCLMIFTGIYAGVSICQLRTMRQTLEYAERAWIVYVSTGPVSHPGEEKKYLDIVDGKLDVELTFINAGKSPAFNITNRMDHSIVGKDSPPPCSLTRVPGPLVSRGVLAGNGQSSPIRPRMTIPITQDDITALETTKEKRLYLFGFITYDDEFRHPRKTQFCLVRIPNDEGGSFSYCSCGNILE